nr:MAG TPA: hypothetical protein [Bacteriophage sp.]
MSRVFSTPHSNTRICSRREYLNLYYRRSNIYLLYRR